MSTEDPRTDRYTAPPATATPDPTTATPPPAQTTPDPATATPPPAQPTPGPTHTPPPPPQPAWRPPPADHGRTASVIFGVIILLIGLWFFASQTLDLDLPDLEWGQLWPLILIAIGAWIVFGAMRRAR
jgi:uncharacterized integral membrane protein